MIRPLLSVSFPIMLSIASNNLMHFIDRLFLAHYSLATMNAVSVGSAGLWSIVLFPLTIALICEVFVGQKNGAKLYKEAGLAANQMLYFSLAIAALFIPLGYIASDYVLPPSLRPDGASYVKIMLCMGGLPVIIAAFTGFFTGITSPRIITIAALVGNAVNLILDPLFIFGFSSLPAMGGKGAAIATVLGALAQTLVMARSYFSQPVREKYGTHILTYNSALLWKQVKTGTPSSVAHTLEVVGWAAIAQIAAAQGTLSATIYSVSVTVFIVFVSLTEGIGKGVTALAANFIGAKNKDKIPKLLKSAIICQLVCLALLSPFMLFKPELILSLFNLNDTLVLDPLTLRIFRVGISLMWLFMLVDGLTWIFNGAITAAGDTQFIMIVNPLSFFFFCYIPWRINMVGENVNVMLQNSYFVLYAFACLLLVFYRYRRGKWKKIQL